MPLQPCLEYPSLPPNNSVSEALLIPEIPTSGTRQVCAWDYQKKDFEEKLFFPFGCRTPRRAFGGHGYNLEVGSNLRPVVNSSASLGGICLVVGAGLVSGRHVGSPKPCTVIAGGGKVCCIVPRRRERGVSSPRRLMSRLGLVCLDRRANCCSR